MSGFCSNGAVPPACYAGQKWPPNDPLFFMHHAVRITPAAHFSASPSSHRIVTQMIDKAWYDWQKKSPKNKYSYGGGSVTPLPSFQNFTIFPTGLPPYLNVSVSSGLGWACVSHTLHLPLSLTARSPVTVYGILQSGMSSTQQGTRYAMFMHRCQ